jgi:hypothetical protein
MADEQLARNLYQEAIALGDHATPDVALYARIQSLKYMASMRWGEPALAVVIEGLQIRTQYLVDVFPFFTGPCSQWALLRQSGDSVALMRRFLHALIAVIDRDPSDGVAVECDHAATVVLYQAYEACLKRWYQEHSQQELPLQAALRQKLITALLREKRWDTQQIQNNLNLPWIAVARDEAGWLAPQGGFMLPEDPLLVRLVSIDGFEVDHKTGVISLYGQPGKGAPAVIQQTFTLFDLIALFEQDIQGAVFSLDQANPDLPYHPFQQMRIVPANLYATQLQQTMLLTDYLLKFFTVGCEAGAHFPYPMRGLEQLLAGLPPHLRAIIEDYQRAPHEGDQLQRFWIEAAEIHVADDVVHSETQDCYRLGLSDVKMVVKTHRMQRNGRGELIDHPDFQEGWDLYVLTSAQWAALKAQPRSLPGFAWVFVRDTANSARIACVERGCLSGEEWPLQGQEALLEPLWQARVEPSGKIATTPETAPWRCSLIQQVAGLIHKPHRLTPETVFTLAMTAHYAEFGEYFPEFARLRALSKGVILVRMMRLQYQANQDAIATLTQMLAADDNPVWATPTEQQRPLVEAALKERANLEALCWAEFEAFKRAYELSKANAHTPSHKEFMDFVRRRADLVKRMPMITREDLNQMGYGDFSMAPRLASALLKKNLGERLKKRQGLAEEYQRFGIKEADAQASNLSRHCLWVPSAIREEVLDGRLRRVYGGVAIVPQVRFLAAADPAHGVLMKRVTQGPGQCRLEAGYVNQARRLTQDLQAREPSAVHMPLFLRRVEAARRGDLRFAPVVLAPPTTRWGRFKEAILRRTDPILIRWPQFWASKVAWIRNSRVYQIGRAIVRVLQRVLFFFFPRLKSSGIPTVLSYPSSAQYRRQERETARAAWARAKAGARQEPTASAGPGAAVPASAAPPPPVRVTVPFRAIEHPAFGGVRVPIVVGWGGGGEPPGGGGGGDSSSSDSSDEEPFPSEDTARAPRTWTIKARLKAARLPTQGRIRFVPRENYDPSRPLERGPNHGFYDRFGNEWTKGPSRTPGEPFEWDVQLSDLGRLRLGWASRDGKHINVSLKGRLTHR